MFITRPGSCDRYGSPAKILSIESILNYESTSITKSKFYRVSKILFENGGITMKELEHNLGYIFKNKELLKQALTRESAIQEKLPNAAKQSYQNLEFIGDAALKHAISIRLFYKLQESQEEFTEAELHNCAEKLIGNENVLPQIADSIDLSGFIIKGKGETLITSKMKADILEAILGAIRVMPGSLPLS